MRGPRVTQAARVTLNLGGSGQRFTLDSRPAWRRLHLGSEEFSYAPREPLRRARTRTTLGARARARAVACVMDKRKHRFQGEDCHAGVRARRRRPKRRRSTKIWVAHAKVSLGVPRRGGQPEK